MNDNIAKQHYPNPFGFVPFAQESPTLKSTDEWLKIDEKLVTGYLNYQITALTPIHIVGQQQAEGKGCIKKSYFYRRNEKICIPGTSIRGMLRKFIEAVCNCWASQITPYFLTEKNHRNLAFMVIDSKDEFIKKDGKVDTDLKFSLSEEFYPQSDNQGKIDLASFLFGFIPNKGIGWKGRIRFEDAEISKSNLTDKCKMPDITGDAFMGRPNPSAKTWWYHKPFGIRRRKKTVLLNNTERTFDVPDFIGSGYRGRKFYFHQNPNSCVEEYTHNWPSIYEFDLECLEATKKSNVFRIYFEEIPLRLLYLIIWALAPAYNLKHKMGYGKAYGYGSVHFDLVGCKFNSLAYSKIDTLDNTSFFNELKDINWSNQTLQEKGIMEFIHYDTFKKLSHILYYEEPLNYIFTYPKFSEEGFLPVVRMRDLKDVLNDLVIPKSFVSGIMELTEDEAYKIAKRLSQKGIKPALHFEVYQNSANGYNEYMKTATEKVSL